MSAQWIKLTGRDGAEVFVNMASATMMRPRKHWTRIWFMGARDDHVDVFESAAEIVLSLDEKLARQAEVRRPPPPPVIPAPVYNEPKRPEPRPAPAPEPYTAPPPALPRTAINGVAAKLAKAAAVKVSRAPIPSLAEPPERPQMSETVAEQRDQRARRRASAIMDERRQQLARKLEQMRREKGGE